MSRTKRKRDVAFNSVCEKFTGLNVHGRGRDNASYTSLVRSKSILKKAYSGRQVRFTRKTDFSDRFVCTFDEVNIQEVQTCLHPRNGVNCPKTPRSVVLLLQENTDEAASDVPSLSSPQASSPLPYTAAAVPPLTFGDLRGTPPIANAVEDNMNDDDEEENSRVAKRGRLKQFEIEEGQRFREMLRFGGDVGSGEEGGGGGGGGGACSNSPLVRAGCGGGVSRAYPPSTGDSPLEELSLRLHSLHSPTSPSPLFKVFFDKTTCCQF